MEKVFQIALTQVEGIGSVLFRQLVSHFGSAEEVFKTKSEKLLKISGIGHTIVEKFAQKQQLIEKAQKIFDNSIAQNIEILSVTDSKYPSRLKGLYDSPALLYFTGKGSLNAPRSIGIVGTRQATDYGKKITNEIVEGLKSYQAQIISGLAYGIDITAHKAAIENQLPTMAVVANGLDIVYPAAHSKYLDEIKETGGVVSENCLGMQPIKSSFLARNRIIAALSDLVIVVESAGKGGALVTAEFANNYHREVFAVPGMLNSKFSEGTNKLIAQNKAQIYTKVEDLIESLNWDLQDSKPKKQAIEKNIDLSAFTDDEAQVITMLKNHQEMQIDDLSWQSGIGLNRLAALLLNLEFMDIVKAMPGKKFALKG